ncbi:MAG TPA: response regulator transcription factor [Caulobacter sp.]|nr:response regulator transcription factor [Caulobacter sp.]
MRLVFLDLNGAATQPAGVDTTRFGIDLAEDLDEAAMLAAEPWADLLVLTGRAAPAITAAVSGLRRRGVTAPILALAESSDSLAALLEAGADDAVPVACPPGELTARCAALVRRVHGLAEPVVDVGPLHLDLARRTVTVLGRPLSVTGREYALLEALSLRRGHILRRETLLDHLYGAFADRHAKVIDVYVCRLRQKLSEACGRGDYLHTEKGRGFVLRDPDALAA